jgi:5S rRNA maturation endonuclease (ribonuclease M5)
MITQDKILSIRNKISHDTHIIVEGKRDKAALEKMQFKRIIMISGKSDDRLVQTLKDKKIKRIVLLTDFDREGEKKYKILSVLLGKNGIKTDFTVRDKFKKTFGIRKIEEASRIAKLMDDYINGNSHSTVGKAVNRNKFLHRKKHLKRRRKITTLFF